MAKTIFSFETTAGKIWSKKRDSAGRVYHTGPNGKTKQQNFAGANQSLRRVITQVDGEPTEAIREAETAADLENVTQIPFTSDVLFTRDSADEKAGKSEALKAERNRFLGFWDKQTDDPDRDEAAKRYLEFRNEIAEIDDPQERAVRKAQYNIGGS